MVVAFETSNRGAYRKCYEIEVVDSIKRFLTSPNTVKYGSSSDTESSFRALRTAWAALRNAASAPPVPRNTLPSAELRDQRR